ncbi:hypothetical protein ACFLTE_00445 [Bacteroidota bacterium]
MLKNIIYILIIIIGIIFSSCSDDPAFDILLGGQPRFLTEDGYDKKLNVFGVLRPDLIQNYSQSFIHLERTLAAVNDIENGEDIFILDATITSYLVEDGVLIDSFHFEYQNPDNFFNAFEYRDTSFIPIALQKYKLICKRIDYETIEAETIIPKKPHINGNINADDNSINFNLTNDTSIFLFDIYLIDNEDFDFSRIMPSEGANTFVKINPEFTLSNNTILFVYSYDTNLATYLSYSNNFIKPGAYRPPITTVNGGYGCFGSMNFEVFTNF